LARRRRQHAEARALPFRLFAQDELSRAFDRLSGTKITLPTGTRIVITQALGGSYTVASELGLARISDKDADAIGIERSEISADAQPAAQQGVVNEEAVWNQLKTCYDPEIPLNIVDLGLVYDCRVLPQENNGAKVEVKMTLTALGCGMGPVLCQEAKSKIESLAGVGEADVELVWDPPWNQGMISEAGKMQLGLI
jgi:probable FeS assembly SUF system protein SufT